MAKGSTMYTMEQCEGTTEQCDDAMKQCDGTMEKCVVTRGVEVTQTTLKFP